MFLDFTRFFLNILKKHRLKKVKTCHGFFSFDARDKSAGGGIHWSDDKTFSGRAQFRLYNRKVNWSDLHIINIKDKDAGIYRCRVDFNHSQTVNSRINFTVICKLK